MGKVVTSILTDQCAITWVMKDNFLVHKKIMSQGSDPVGVRVGERGGEMDQRRTPPRQDT